MTESIGKNISSRACYCNYGNNELNKKLVPTFQKQSENTNSIGLGLEMSKKICDLYHYDIQYQFINDMHLFSINFN